MEKDKKALDRFGFTHSDECVKVSQCVGCSMNSGKTCEVFGQKPVQYVRASIGKKCPKRKE